jgi:transcriptional regulator with XRE-family HTH domain
MRSAKTIGVDYIPGSDGANKVLFSSREVLLLTTNVHRRRSQLVRDVEAAHNVDMEKVGYWVRAMRENAVLSQGELAEKVGISQNALSAIETGRSRPRMSTIRKLAAALRVDPSQLVVGAGEAAIKEPPTGVGHYDHDRAALKLTTTAVRSAGKHSLLHKGKGKKSAGLHIIIGAAPDPEVSLQRDLRLVKAALLYADSITLCSPKVMFLAGVGSLQTMNTREQIAYLQEVAPHLDMEPARLASLMDGLKAYQQIKGKRNRTREELLLQGRLESAISQGWDGIKATSAEMLRRAGAGEFSDLIKGGVLDIYPLHVTDDVEDLVTAYVEVIEEAISRSISYPLLDDRSSNLIQAMAREGHLAPPDGSLKRGRAIALAAGLFERLPMFDESSVTEIWDVRLELQRSLTNFRSAMLEYASTIKSAAWDDDFPSDADNVFHEKVAPTLVEIEEAVKSNKYLLELTHRITEKPILPSGSVLGLLLAHEASMPALVSAALGVGGTIIAASDAHREYRKNRKQYEQNQLYFYYGTTKRLGEPQ